MKKIRIIIILLCFLGIAAAGICVYKQYKDSNNNNESITEEQTETATEAAEATGEQADPDYLQKYREFLSEDEISGWGSGSTTIYAENCKFIYIYLDDDDIPELVVYNDTDASHASGYYQVYTYENGQVISLVNTGDEFGYYEKQSVFVWSSTGMGVTTYAYGKVSGTEIDYFAQVTQVSDAEDGESGEPEYEYYRLGGTLNMEKAEEIDKDSFEEILNHETGGESMTSISEWNDNTEENRNTIIYSLF